MVVLRLSAMLPLPRLLRTLSLADLLVLRVFTHTSHCSFCCYIVSVGHSLRDQVTAIQRQKNSKAVFSKQPRVPMARHSSSRSDCGDEAELRKSSISMSGLVRASFERRPSFIMESYADHGSSQLRTSFLVSGDAAASFKVNNMRRSSNWEFLDSLDDILDLVAMESNSTSNNFIENLDQVDHQLYMDDTPMRLSETVGSISAFSLGESVHDDVYATTKQKPLAAQI
jgi:hypothetical protein